MASTYEKIETTTLGSATNSVTFSSISGSYTDLVLISSYRGTTTSGAYQAIRFNGDSGSNYSHTFIYGGQSGDPQGSARNANITHFYGNTTGGSMSTNRTGFTQNVLYIMNYSNTVTFKTGILRGGHAETNTDMLVQMWRSTSAITSITSIADGAGNFAAGSTFTLYGILKA